MVLDGCFKTTCQSPAGCRATKGKGVTATSSVMAPPTTMANKQLLVKETSPETAGLLRGMCRLRTNPQRWREPMSAMLDCKVS